MSKKFIVFDPSDGNNDEFDTEEEARARAVEVATWILLNHFSIQVALSRIDPDGNTTWDAHEFTDPIRVV